MTPFAKLREVICAGALDRLTLERDGYLAPEIDACGEAVHRGEFAASVRDIAAAVA